MTRLPSKSARTPRGWSARAGMTPARCRTTASCRASTPVPARSRSSVVAGCGTASAALIVGIAIASILIRGFTFGIDFKGGTTVSFPRGDCDRQPGRGRLPGDAGPRPGIGGHRRQRLVGNRADSVGDAAQRQDRKAAQRAVRQVPPQGRRRSAQQDWPFRTRRCPRRGAGRSPRRRSSPWWCSWCWSACTSPSATSATWRSRR